MMIIETERLILSPWQESDAGAEYSLGIIRTVFAAPETYAIVLKDTGEPVDSCGIMSSDGLHSANMKQGEAEMANHTNNDIISPLGGQTYRTFLYYEKGRLQRDL